MGDIWPYGPPRYTTRAQVIIELKANGMSEANAEIGTAIGIAEGGLDLSVINDTPSTGDYSVGTFQINYLGSLDAERTRLFGTPKQLIDGGIIAQAHAMAVLWRESGFTPWSTYNNGEYRQYLQGGGTPPGPKPGIATPPIPVPSPGTDSWGVQIRHSVYNLNGTFKDLNNASLALDKLRG
jgi:hypothetical protein